MRIGKYKLKVVGEPLESCPFAGGHFAYTLAVYLTFDMSDRSEICETIVDDQIPLATHSPTDEGRRDAVHVLDLIAKTVACGLMPGFVFPQGLEINVAEVILHRNGVFFDDVRDLRLSIGGLREFERRAVDVIPECHDVYALPVLRDAVVLAVQDLVQRGVAHVLQRVDDDLERPSLIMNREAFYVLAEDDFRPMVIADPDNIEEQGSAGHALVIVVEPLFPAGDGECLTGEAGKTDIEIGDVPLVNFGDVSVDLGRGVEVGLVGLLGILIPFAGENSLNLAAEGSIEPHADSAYPCEQVDGFVDLSVSHSSAS